ncbi:hypothetical protein [Flavobacterium aurantiibacter]|uniref:hypothetical protein n=1 Tax=Flavobacterium aurantiibacter TaxID=2023067 RepID=UPI0010559C83|nr:hypothetical protein [Flavobacterium aurantiibacter]
MSHKSYIAIENVTNKVKIDILGEAAKIKYYQLKRNELITAKDSFYSFGRLTKICYSFLVAKDLNSVKTEKFILNSNNNGISYDKNLELFQNKDTVYFKLLKN